jgi:hypothetical protein
VSEYTSRRTKHSVRCFSLSCMSFFQNGATHRTNGEGNDEPITKPRIDRTDCWHFKNDASVVESLYISDPPPFIPSTSTRETRCRCRIAREAFDGALATEFHSSDRLLTVLSFCLFLLLFFRGSVCADFAECLEEATTPSVKGTNQVLHEIAIP